MSKTRSFSLLSGQELDHQEGWVADLVLPHSFHFIDLDGNRDVKINWVHAPGLLELSPVSRNDVTEVAVPSHPLERTGILTPGKIFFKLLSSYLQHSQDKMEIFVNQKGMKYT